MDNKNKKGKPMELKEIREVIDLMDKNDLKEFEIERGDFKLRLKREPEHVPAPVAAVPPPVQVATPPVASVSAPAAPAPVDSNLKEITSPMVGTVYLSPSPDSPPYVQVGKEVTEDTIVCIIEAMKVMNEIKADVKGVVTEILMESGKSVDFGKPIFRVRTS